ncbi:hypothetical protein V6N13_074588 [Hibiscus sabdariffa]|uniref:Uncharacterized protein n=1 Tax=Hibiscus sabdariffa TaxID=183260 RepID=A0ABR2U8W5_9ROSI
MTYFSGFNPCVQTYFPTLGGQGHLKVARWAPPLIFSEDKATSRWRGGPHPSYFRWTRPPQGGEVVPTPHIFDGQGHLKVARWAPQTSATRLPTAARLEWL